MSSRRRVEQLREALPDRVDDRPSSRRPTAWSARARRPWPGRGPRCPGRPRGSAPAGCARAPRPPCPRPPRGRRGRSAGCRSPRRRTAGLVVHLGHQRAGRVDGLERSAARPAGAPRARRRGRRTPRSAPSGTSSSSSTKTAPRDSRFDDDVLVVHDLLADVDRGAVQVERLLHGDHGAVDAGAVAARGGQQHGAAPRPAPAIRIGRHPQVRSRSCAHRRALPSPRVAPRGPGDLARAAGTRPADRQRHRRVGRPARRGVGRGPGRPVEPPARA